MTGTAASIAQRRRAGKRRVGRLAALGLATALAGCQTLLPHGEPQQPQSTPEARPAPTPTPPVQPQAGVLPRDRERHRVALLVPTSGPDAAIGQSIADAANMAVLDTGGDTIRVTIYDTGPGARPAVERALTDGAELILGPLLSDNVRDVAPLAAARNIPVVAFTNDVEAASPNVFVMGFTPTQSVSRVVSYAASQGARRFAIVAPQGTYGDRSTSAFIAAVRESGGRVVTTQRYDPSQPSVNAMARALVASGQIDALMIADSGRSAATVLSALKKAGLGSPIILGTELWNTERSLRSNPDFEGALFASVNDGLYEQLAAKYRDRFGRAPYRLSSLGYDSVLLATKIARDWKPEAGFPLGELRDPGGFAGIDGAFRFSQGPVAERALDIKRLGGGQERVVDPAPTRF